MDSSEPSTNGTSVSNLFRLSSLLNDDIYAAKAKETIRSFESEVLQYPWLFASFMPGIVASHLGLKGVVVAGAGGVGQEKIKAFEKQPRGALMTFARINAKGNEWLRGRNELLRDFGRDGKARVLVCEGGTCREEGVVEVGSSEEGTTGTKGFGMGSVNAALPSKEEPTTIPSVEAERKEEPSAPAPE
jgi:uncharacterized protein YyaL (SSP411 family)